MSCYGCKERFIGCHSVCEKYIEAEKRNKERLDKIKAARNRENDYVAYKIGIIKKNKEKAGYF